jgi:hypothetical protein
VINSRNIPRFIVLLPLLMFNFNLSSHHSTTFYIDNRVCEDIFYFPDTYPGNTEMVRRISRRTSEQAFFVIFFLIIPGK